MPKPIIVILYGLLPLVFVVLLTVGLYGDSQQWWRGLPYLTNMLTTATGAALGIPIAVGILQRIIAMQSDREYWLRTVRVLKRNVDGIATSLRSAVHADDAAEATVAVDNAILGLLNDFGIFRRKATDLKESADRPTGPASREYADQLRAHAGDVLGKIESVRDVCRSYLRSNPWVTGSLTLQVAEDWASLESVVKPVIVEANDEWIPDIVYETFRHATFDIVTLQDVEDMLRKIEGVVNEACSHYNAEIHYFTNTRNPIIAVVGKVHPLKELLEVLPKLEKWRDRFT